MYMYEICIFSTALSLYSLTQIIWLEYCKTEFICIIIFTIYYYIGIKYIHLVYHDPENVDNHFWKNWSHVLFMLPSRTPYYIFTLSTEPTQGINIL